ncbi:LOW QUALITY PROTEIN: pre-mRNA cleavage complex 2 protein Pcf11 [Sebastes umbrosus]|uniref:LOW QUALITY PROTEIN: pre-mRNA cleavage complex 2 protein Pcf11 n=1 Tax=Sebastes umbrosus TaxID=72105 RepID=UPI00189D56E6|nr:LOW QUALITY PROTEIN: pre-mRNA cleavage complex 2 protein Pcf11 [Sebastes umbrosus]
MDCLLLAGYGTVGLSCSEMEDKAGREDACGDYQSSLEDLTFNSKPHINMLTILAEENRHCAKDIVAIIEAQISKAPSAEKLPVLYLVDSIVKNVGGEYLAVFAKNLITSFICVFEKVDENTRKSLFKLRSTWDDVFPLKKLYALDVRVNSVDPAWPIKPLPPTVNASASIHVNPKFLKQSEEAPSPQPAPTQPPAPPPPPAPPAPQPVPVPVPVPVVSPSSLTQEQLIRQQLLAKQKQLLELQQKKIELELEQTKAQLAGGFVIPTPVSTAAQSMSAKTTSQPAPVVRPWIPPQTQTDAKSTTRDPRLNRTGPPAASQSKEQPAGKKDGPATTGSPALTPEKSTRPDKVRTPRKEVSEEKPKLKPPSPMVKSVQSKNKQTEAETQKSADGTKKDPRLKKRTQDKTVESKDEDVKEKKRCTDKKEREEAAARVADLQRFNKGKMVNGSVPKHDRAESAEKPEFKTGGNARTHARKRTRSRSRSRSPASSPKRKDRPKSRARSSSLSPLPSHKLGKPRRVRADEPEHGKPGRGDRLVLKKNQSESRRSKRPAEDRHSESRDSHSPRSHDGGGGEVKEAPHRWRSGWEENKHPKLPEESHVKPAPQRHKQQYGTPTRPTTPRTPKHRLSVDANLQIPEALNTASKKDLLRRASKRLESGEISQEDFLNMAHQIKHFFQYQEEKQRSDSWDDDGEFSAKKLLASPTAAQPRPPRDRMDPAEVSYYEHKLKLRKTQVAHRAAGEEWEGEESPEEGVEEAGQGEKSPGQPLAHKYSRAPRERQGERRSKEREEPRPPLGPMIEEYNHGKEFPTLKALPGLRFRRRADPREPSEREWTSPLTERQRLDEHEEPKSGYDAPRRYGPAADSRNQQGPPLPGTVVHRKSPSPAGLDAPTPRFERERLSPLHQKDSAEMSPIPRFESPNSEHSDDGPLNLGPPPPPLPPKSILKAPSRVGQLSSVRQHSESPGHTPPHDGGHPPPRYDGPGHMGPSRPQPPGWYEGGGPGRYDDSSRFEGPHHQGPGRFDGGVPPHHNMPERFDGPHMSHGPMRGGDGMGRFDGPPHPQGPRRFDGPIGQQPPVRFEGPGPGPGHFEGPMQRFDAPRRFENNMAPGPGSGPMGFQQQRPMRFDGPPNQMGPMRFDGPMHFEAPGQPVPRFDIPNVPHQGGPPLYECPPGQQGLRFAPQHNLQQPMRPMAPPHYDNPIAPPQNFNMPPQRFPEPINTQFSAGPMAFSAQPNLQPAGNFNMQPAPPFNQPGPAPFYNPADPAGAMQQPVNILGNLSQPFLPSNPVPFGQQIGQVAPPENHFGQVDVNDLLTKLISNGIIKPSQPDAAPTPSAEPSSTPPTAPPPVVVEEEEEELEVEEEDEDLPDLTGFKVDDMKPRYESVVTKLYSGNQCCLCSMRFTAAQTDLYADHLDWHFRQNHAGKVASKKITHRRWYYGLRDWVEFEEIADLEERAKSNFFEKESEEDLQKSQAAQKEKEFQSVKATKDQVGESCEICQEAFETYWVEEEEDWFLKDALRVDEKNFHPACFEDYKNTSSYLDVTPSPNKLLTDHPLSAFIKTEEEEEGASCVVAAAAAAASAAAAAIAAAAASVKQEVKTEACELPDVKEEEEEVLTDEVQCDENKA